MNTDHPTDWAQRYVKAKALREAAADLHAVWLDLRGVDPEAAASNWLRARADELEQQ